MRSACGRILFSFFFWKFLEFSWDSSSWKKKQVIDQTGGEREKNGEIICDFVPNSPPPPSRGIFITDGIAEKKNFLISTISHRFQLLPTLSVERVFNAKSHRL